MPRFELIATQTNLWQILFILVTHLPHPRLNVPGMDSRSQSLDRWIDGCGVEVSMSESYKLNWVFGCWLLESELRWSPNYWQLLITNTNQFHPLIDVGSISFHLGDWISQKFYYRTTPFNWCDRKPRRKDKEYKLWMESSLFGGSTIPGVSLLLSLTGTE